MVWNGTTNGLWILLFWFDLYFRLEILWCVLHRRPWIIPAWIRSCAEYFVRRFCPIVYFEIRADLTYNLLGIAQNSSGRESVNQYSGLFCGMNFVPSKRSFGDLIDDCSFLTCSDIFSCNYLCIYLIDDYQKTCYR